MGFFNTVLLSAQGARPRNLTDLPPMPEVNFELQGMSQFSHMVGVLLSWIMFIIPLVAGVVILLGVLYIVAPPLRNLLDGGRGRFRESMGEGQGQGQGQGGPGGMPGGMDQVGGPSMGGMNPGMGGMNPGMGGMNPGMGGRGGRGAQGGMQGMPRMGMSFVLPVAISIGLMNEGSWAGVKMYIKETLILMVFVGIMIAITSLGTVFGLGFNIGVMIMQWLSGVSSNIPNALGDAEAIEDLTGGSTTGFE